MLPSTRRLVIISSLLTLLAACGGGGGGGSSGPDGPPANRAPTISAPADSSVLVGRELVISPTASDPDGQALSFSVANRPAWLSFNASTGELRGTPQAADVGTYSGIQVTVSDGQAQASATLRITVAAQTLGRATLSWEAPLQRTDGSPLTNLAGFRIYYGTSAGNLGSVIQVNDPGARNAVVENLTPGTWYFAATAIDAAGMESARSNTASKTIA